MTLTDAQQPLGMVFKSLAAAAGVALGAHTCCGDSGV